ERTHEALDNAVALRLLDVRGRDRHPQPGDILRDPSSLVFESLSSRRSPRLSISRITLLFAAPLSARRLTIGSSDSLSFFRNARQDHPAAGRGFMSAVRGRGLIVPDSGFRYGRSWLRTRWARSSRRRAVATLAGFGPFR